jgi:hypothetical protein
MTVQAIITIDQDGFVETRLKEGRKVVARMIHSTGDAAFNFEAGLDWIRSQVSGAVGTNLDDRTGEVSEEAVEQLSEAHGSGSSGGRSRF